MRIFSALTTTLLFSVVALSQSMSVICIGDPNEDDKYKFTINQDETGSSAHIYTLNSKAVATNQMQAFLTEKAFGFELTIPEKNKGERAAKKCF